MVLLGAETPKSRLKLAFIPTIYPNDEAKFIERRLLCRIF